MAAELRAKLSFDVTVEHPRGPTIEARLDDVFRHGPVAVLFGPSGSGKTTVLRSLAGLQRPARGRITLGDAVWFDSEKGVETPPQRRRVGYLAQQYALFPHLSVEDNVAYGLRGLSAEARRDRVRATLERFRIDELRGRRVRELSGGEQQRVALARTLAPGPELLLLDEPLSALDSGTRAALRAELRRDLLRAETPAIVVTHDYTEALALGDSLMVMADGRLLQSGPIGEVFERPNSEAVARTVGVDCVAAAELVKIDGELAVYRVGEREVVGLAREADGESSGYIFIRAENVTLAAHAPSGESARNHLEAVVTEVAHEGPLVRVRLDCSFPLAALITRHSLEEMDLRAGSKVWANVKAPAVHFVASPRVDRPPESALD